MGGDEFVTEFLERGLLGFYLSVAREGEVEAGDAIVELSRDVRFTVTEIARLYAHDREDVEGLLRAVELDVLPESRRANFGNRLPYRGRRRTGGVRRDTPSRARPGDDAVRDHCARR